MNNLNFKKFIEDSRLIKLSKDEKSEVLNYLQALMNNKPIVSRPQLAGHTAWSSNPPAGGQNFNPLLIFTKPMPAFIILALLVGGGASFAAEKSLPGDILYPVKVSLNENIRSWAALSSEAKIALEAELAQRRLEEAEKLAAKNRLSDETRAEIEEDFEIHASRVENGIAELKTSDIPKAIRANADFHTSLEAHVKIIEDIKLSADEDVELNLVKLSTRVKNKKGNLNNNEGKNEDLLKNESQAEMKAAAEGKFKAAANKIEEVKKYVANKNRKLSAETKAKINTRIGLAENTLAEGKAKFAAEAYSDAFLLFQKAHNIAQEVKLLVKAKIELESFPSISSAEPSATPFVTQSANPSPTASVSRTPTSKEDNSGRGNKKDHDDNRDRDNDRDENEIKAKAEAELESESNSHKGSGKIKINLDFD